MTQPVDSLVQQWAVTPHVRAAGPRMLSVQVAYAAVPVALIETGPGEIELRAHWNAPPELAADPDGLNALATKTTFARGGQLRCSASGGAIDVAYPVYLEGLTRNKFYDAATEVAKAAVSIDESVRGAQTPAPTDTSAAGPVPQSEPVSIDEPAALPEPMPEPETTQPAPAVELDKPAEPPFMAAPPVAEAAPVETPPVETPPVETPPVVPTPVMYSPPIQDAPAMQPPAQQSMQQPMQQPVEPAHAPMPPMQPVAPQWTPTHTVPPGGVPAWAAPDPAQPPVTQLPPGLPVRLVERQGGWARIDTDNGWSGWVDGRPLPDPPTA